MSRRPTEYLISYDITEPKRLNRVAKLLSSYGDRLQKSVFQARLTEKQIGDVWKLLKAEIDEETDRVMVIPLCSRCLNQIQFCGEVPTIPDKNLLVF
jgi:CRISPR-associated protein Cas2